MKPGLYEARSLIGVGVAYVVLDDTGSEKARRMRLVLESIRDHPRSRSVRQSAAWALGDMGED